MRKVATLGGAVAAVAVGVALSAASCSQTPTNVPIRTFEGANRMAVVCLNVQDSSTVSIGGQQMTFPTPVAENNCAPVPNGVSGGTLPFHLIALVTQTTRGELAAVDLTAGYVVDEDQSTPGINFIPVGTQPTDVVAAPDGLWSYVSSASPTKPALYAIDNTRILGDSTALKSSPLELTDLHACSLPQAPRALGIVTAPGAATADAGASVDGGGPSPYLIVALLGTDPGVDGQVVTIDPQPLRTNTAGQLPPCTIVGRTNLDPAIAATVFPGPPWPNGVPYVDGGIDLADALPPVGPASICGSTSTGGTPSGGNPAPEDAGAGDAAAEGGEDAGAPVDSGFTGPGDGGFPLALPTDPEALAAPVSMVMRDDADAHLVYVADGRNPLIHVIDLADPTAPKPMAPLLATSLAQPTRSVFVGRMALSPPTREYKRYLYATDQQAGTLMVYDVTDPVASPHVPLQRPNAVLNPFAPIDRIAFSSSVAAVSFVTHDWPVQTMQPPAGPNPAQAAYQGVLCNPNPDALPKTSQFNDLGAYYRVDQAGLIQTNGSAESFPGRLRGVFAFVTLSNGSMEVVDVDDWDAPCRRPDPMVEGMITNSLDIPQQPGTGAYEVPTAFSTAVANSQPVTLEPFFPVSQPNRIRSSVLVRNDPTTGVHIPTLTQLPSLTSGGTPIATTGLAGIASPLLLPTELDPGFQDPDSWQTPAEPNPALRTYFPDAGLVPDPSTTVLPGVRLSFEDPTVQTSQTWRIAYEGVIPSTSRGQNSTLSAAITPNGGYGQLVFTSSGVNLCSKGIEDWSIGQARANAALTDIYAMGVVTPPTLPDVATLPSWTSDYVEITDDILSSDDPYWSVNSDAGNSACWNDLNLDTPTARYNYCASRFGAPGADPDQNPHRDLPILQAYSDHLVVGRFAFSGAAPRVQGRTIDPGSTNNQGPLQAIQCCFHAQANFQVRTGGEWSATGDITGFLHHVVTSSDPATKNRCVLSCNPQDALLNARSFDVPWATASTCTKPPSQSLAIGRNNELALRNPIMSYVIWSGCGPFQNPTDHTLNSRDLTWTFAVGGGFAPLALSVAGTNGTPVSPRASYFIPSLGQLGVVDGAQQGLVLIDLNSLTITANYF